MLTIDQYIATFESEINRDRNFRSTLWQPAADHIVPRWNFITKWESEGMDKMRRIHNTTPQVDAEDMASGLSGTIIPNGQEFFGVSVPDPMLARNNRVQRYLGHLSAKAHELLFSSNFVSQFNEALLSMIVFGPGNLFTRWDDRYGGLMYKCWDIGTYTVRNDAYGIAQEMYIRPRYSASEAYTEFGEKAGPKAVISAKDPKSSTDFFEYLYCIKPRDSYNPAKTDRFNMPYEAVYLNKTEKTWVRSGGFAERPFAVAHWRKSQSEKWGRGRGLTALPACRQLQQMEKDLTECGNKHNNPPLEVLSSFEGRVRVTPGAQNRVSEMNSIRSLPEGAKGNFPVTKDMIERKEEEIHRLFYMHVFRQFMDMKGDRRVQLEIRERKNQALRLIGAPVLNIAYGLLTPTLTRSLLLLIRNGKIMFEGSPDPPDELSGANFGIEFKGEVALALRDQQARGFMDFSAFLGNMQQSFPKDDLSIYVAKERAIPRMATAFGVHVDDLATEEEIQAKQAKIQKDIEAARQMQVAQMAAQGYKDTSKTAEDGSPAAQIAEQMTETTGA